MKKLLLLFISLFSFCGNIYPQSFNDLYTLYKHKEYFRLRDLSVSTRQLNTDWQKIYFSSLVKSLFCDFKGANNDINKLTDEYFAYIPDSLITELYKIKIINHANLFEYKDAFDCSNIINSKYKKYLSKEEGEDFESDVTLWKAIIDAPSQETIKPGAQKIKMKRDIAGLWNLPVNAGNTLYNFIFDTGANFSVMVESAARKSGLKIIDAKIKVGTSTNIKVESKVAVADSIKIGDIIIKNVVFLILPDEALSFGWYKINGIIGNPVLRSFEEITINDSLEMIIPDTPSTRPFSNLTFEEFTPVIQMVQDKDTINMIFDSGGDKSMLYFAYYKINEKTIKDKYKMIKIKIGGAGGSLTLNGYILKNIILGTGNNSAELNEIRLLAEYTKEKNEFFYGVIGQDYISSFKEVTINFKNMFIDFRN